MLAQEAGTRLNYSPLLGGNRAVGLGNGRKPFVFEVGGSEKGLKSHDNLMFVKKAVTEVRCDLTEGFISTARPKEARKLQMAPNDLFAYSRPFPP